MNFDDSRTKIIATIGPASSDKDTLRRMFQKGVDVCRLNFSHGDYDAHLQTIKTVRELNKELGIDVSILADLQGPKIRVGQLPDEGILLESGKTVQFVTSECKGKNCKNKVFINYEEFAEDVTKGDTILIDDGKMKLEVIDTNKKDTATLKIIHGGILKSRKGVNMPDTSVSLPSLTEKDIQDAIFALKNDVDWLALSFVRAASDVIELKQLIKRKKKKTYVIAKIEKPQAIDNIDEIIKEADGIMVARGDLGVEVAFDKIPLLQKEIVKKCLDASVPVIIATQMMESMVENFRPTRAEATDVANAVIDGVDTVMLSGETSVGKYPVETIDSMHKIIQYAELHGYTYNRGLAPVKGSPRFIRDSICYSASNMAQMIGAKAIITFTDGGNTASTISGYRPKADIYAFTVHKHLLSILSLLWGVRAFFLDKIDNMQEAIDISINQLKDKGLLKAGDIVIHVGSIPRAVTDKTNMLKVSVVE